MRRQFSLGRTGRRLGSIIGIAIAAVLFHWIQGDQESAPAPATSSEADRRTQSGNGAARPSHPAPAATGAVPAGRYTLQGVVSKVADGDTVTLMVKGKARRVRLDSIDAPEIGHSAQEPGQPYAQAAQQYLATLVDGKTLIAQCYQQDQFDRDVCALMLPDGNSANRVMVTSGYAWAYTARRGDYLNDVAMPELQRQARGAGRGLWAQGGPTAPWKWRYECWRNQRCDAP